MQQIDPCDVEYSLEDFTQQQDKLLRTANSFHVRGDDKYARSVECIVFMITGGKIFSIREMTTDEFGLRSMEEHASIYGTDLSNAQNAESMMRMILGLLVEVITQGVSKINEEFSKFFCAEYFEEDLEENDSPLAPLHIFRNVSSLFRIDVCWLRMSF
jgi:hypothetical protein